jgi:hypothetical protein
MKRRRMKADDLITRLANGPVALSRRAASWRLELAVLVGVPLSLAILLAEYGLRRDLVHAMFWPMFWVKVLFPICIAAAGFVMAQRLARPGVEVRNAWMGAALPVLVLWAMAALTWFDTPMAQRMPSLMGQTWRTCTLRIGLLALPVLFTSLPALRGLAPTRPALAGAAAGVLAGGVGAAVYAMHCVELTAPFLAVWYVLGMVMPVIAGAALGKFFLRW